MVLEFFKVDLRRVKGGVEWQRWKGLIGGGERVCGCVYVYERDKFWILADIGNWWKIYRLSFHYEDGL